MLWNALRSGDFRMAIIYLALSLPAVVLCLTVHETAHGGMAYALGDRTARDAGRMTLSPRAHIDPWGFFCLMLFGFGWARPVPVNISNFKNRRRGMALTALAGPLSNFLLSFLLFALYLLLGMQVLGNELVLLGPSGSYAILSLLLSGQVALGGGSLFLLVLSLFCGYSAALSAGLGAFNLIPVHPLDGSRVVDAFLPFSWSLKLQKYQSVILIVFIAALWFGWLDGIIYVVESGIFRLAAMLFGLG